MIFYIFNTESEAIKAIADIDAAGHTPLQGRNAQTGELSNTGLTTTYAVARERTDGKFIVPKVPDVLLANLPPETIQAFRANNNYTEEEYSSDWFPASEEI